MNPWARQDDESTDAEIDYWLFLDELTPEQQVDIRKRLYTAPNLARNSGKTRHIPPPRPPWRWRRQQC